ncbi:MAG: hypothetical protein MK135_00775 [Polyangiaceae bacterium]|nr:hypothetical protein [Polyangiaceae bacterium]
MLKLRSGTWTLASLLSVGLGMGACGSKDAEPLGKETAGTGGGTTLPPTGAGAMNSAAGGTTNSGGSPAASGGSSSGGTSAYDTQCAGQTACFAAVILDDFQDDAAATETDTLPFTNTAIAAPGVEGYWFAWVDSVIGVKSNVVGTSPQFQDHSLLFQASELAGTNGATVGFSLNQVGANISCAADLGNAEGIELKVKVGPASDVIATPVAHKIRVRLSMPDNIPPSDGGTCTATDGCWGPNEAVIDVDSLDQLQTIQVPFSTFAQPSWALQVPFDLAKITKIELGSIEGGSAINIVLDEIGLYGSGTGGCSTGQGGMGGLGG